MGDGSWYLNNYKRAIWGRWFPGAPLQNEGGIDVPLPAGTPIYALASGKLQGYGNFVHKNGNPGHGVLTERTNVPGLGPANVYYQHMDLTGNFAPCTMGNCGGQIVTRGQLIGHSRGDVGEVEVGINPTWKSVWGDTKGTVGGWITDPRKLLANLASNTAGTTGTTDTTGSSLIGTLNSQDFGMFTGHAFLLLLALLIFVIGFVMLASRPLSEGAKFLV